MEESTQVGMHSEEPRQESSAKSRKSTRRVGRAGRLDKIVLSIQASIQKHEESSAEIQRAVAVRMRNLQSLKEQLSDLQTYLRSNEPPNPEHDNLVRALTRDVGLAARMTASINVAVTRAPALKNYKLIAGE